MKHTVYLDWPRPKLSANATGGWRGKHEAKVAYRNTCGWKAKADGLGKIDADGLHLHYTFFPPTKARHDLDNLFSRMKAATDAISDVTGINDHRFTFSMAMGAVVSPGMVKCEIEWADRQARAA